MRNKKVTIAIVQIVLITLMLVGIGNARVKRISYRQLARFFSNPNNAALKKGDTFGIEIESLRDGAPNVELAEAFKRKISSTFEEESLIITASYPFKRMALEIKGGPGFELTVQRDFAETSQFLDGYLAQESSEITVNQTFATTYNYDLYQFVYFKDTHGVVKVKQIVGIVHNEVLKGEYISGDTPVVFVPVSLWKELEEGNAQVSNGDITIDATILNNIAITRTTLQTLLQTAETELVASFGEEGIFYEGGGYTFNILDSQNPMDELSKKMREQEIEVPQQDVFIVLLLGFLMMLLIYYRFRLFRNDHVTQWLDGKNIGKQVFSALCYLVVIVIIATVASVLIFEANKYNVMASVVDSYDYVVDSLTETGARRYKEFIHTIWALQVESGFETIKAMLMLSLVGGLFLIVIEIIAFTSIQPAKQYLDAVYYDEAGEPDA